MQHCTRLLSVIATLPIVHGIAFGGPAPTATSPERALDGWNPKPTKGPSVAELRRRQDSLYPETCGWVNGDLSSALTCGSGRTCMLYTASDLIDGMAGCCEGSDTQDCGWASSCVDYDTFTAGSCDTDCELNPFNRICTDSEAPYCVTWTYTWGGVADYGCAATSPFGIETVQQDATDPLDTSLTTSITLSVVSDDAVATWDPNALSSIITTNSPTHNNVGPGETVGPAVHTTGPSSGNSNPNPNSNASPGSSSSSKKKTKKVGLGLIIGVVIAGLVILFCIGALVFFFCMKKKKQRQLDANQQAIAAAQANRPQSQYPPQQTPQMMQQQAPMPQNPQPPHNGYFVPPVQNDQKINTQTQVHEYGVPSPISNPSSPAPAYVQPYYAAPNAPPMPTQSPAPYPAKEPTPGTHEVDAISMPHAPASQRHADQPIFEIGGGK